MKNQKFKVFFFIFCLSTIEFMGCKKITDICDNAQYEIVNDNLIKGSLVSAEGPVYFVIDFERFFSFNSIEVAKDDKFIVIYQALNESNRLCDEGYVIAKKGSCGWNILLRECDSYFIAIALMHADGSVETFPTANYDESSFTCADQSGFFGMCIEKEKM